MLWNFMQIVILGDHLHKISKTVFWGNMKKSKEEVAKLFSLLKMIKKKNNNYQVYPVNAVQCSNGTAYNHK